MIWDIKHECMPREEMRALQLVRLKTTVQRMYTNVPFYRAKMHEAGITPQDVQTLDDLSLLPFITKQDLRDTYPFAMFAAPKEEVVRVHASSGTTGQPTVVGYTARDINIWAEVMARTMTAAGADRHSTVHVAYGYGLFTGGLGTHYGAERVGATVVPMSGGNTPKQVMLLKDFGANVLACTPSYALHLAEAIEESGYSLSDFSLKFGVFGAEPWTEGMRKEIEKRLKIRATDIYGLSEIIGPGVSSECHCQNGLHVFEDHFIPEVIDPQTLKPLPYGQEGELVFTCITKEALPLIRYRTRDLTTLTIEPCECGRTLVRMKKVHGRSDDMLIIRGVNVFPSQIESVLMNVQEVAPHYCIVVDRVDNMDRIEVQVEISESILNDTVSSVENVRRKIADGLHSVLGLSVAVTMVEPKTIARSEGKAKRVIDKRKD